MIHWTSIEGRALFETGSTLAECGRLWCVFLNVSQLVSCQPTQIQQSLATKHGRGSLSSINIYYRKYCSIVIPMSADIAIAMRQAWLKQSPSCPTCRSSVEDGQWVRVRVVDEVLNLLQRAEGHDTT